MILLLLMLVHVAFGNDTHALFRRFTDAFFHIKEQHISPPTEETLITAAIEGMLSSLDTFSSYVDPKRYAKTVSHIKKHVGIGIDIVFDLHGVRVSHVFPLSPAEKAGIKKNDHILAINAIPLSSLQSMDIIDLLYPDIPQSLTLDITREQKPLQFTITPTAIAWTPVSATAYKEGILYVRIPHFLAPDIALTIQSLLAQNPHTLILDIRNNPGGLINEGLHTANLFIKEGTAITRLQNRDKITVQTAQGNAFNGRVFVLINRNTASTAEIVAHALKKRATIIGEKSFGKTSLQTFIPLSHGGSLKITTGYAVDNKGIPLGPLSPHVHTSDQTCVDKAFSLARKPILFDNEIKGEKL